MKKLRFVIVLTALFMLSACNESLPPTQISPTLSIRPALTVSPAPATQTPLPPTATTLPDYSELVHLFDYDQSALLNVNWGTKRERDAVISSEFDYLATEHCKVNAILVHPSATGIYPAVIYMHMGAGDRTQFWLEAIDLAKHGVVSLLLDSPFVSGCFPKTQPRAGFITTVIEVRRGIDFLETISAVDPKRIAYVGHSFGATFGGILTGVEPRITAYVLMAGYAQISHHETPDSPDLDAVRYIGHNVTAPVLFQFSNQDEYISQTEALQYYDAAQSSKKILWYDSTHIGLQRSGQADRLAWLSEQLRFVYP